MFSCGERIHCGVDVNFFTIPLYLSFFVPKQRVRRGREELTC
jgi:hypothetical protein